MQRARVQVRAPRVVVEGALDAVCQRRLEVRRLLLVPVHHRQVQKPVPVRARQRHLLFRGACEENLVDDLNLLIVLAKDDKQFKDAFPQAIIRTMILNALKENTSDQQATEVKQEHETDNRYADDLYNRHNICLYST